MPASAKLMLGVVGCGRVFERYHLPALLKSDDWALAAVCEPLTDRRQWIGRLYPDLPVFNAYEDFLAKSSPEALLITTPPASHFPLSVKALDAGLHVMVEKPFALNVDDAEKLFEASQRNQRKLRIGFNRRFHRYYAELKTKLAAIPPDRIKSISSRLIINPDNWNAVSSFHGQDAQGGGVFDDVACHQIDLVPWLFDDRVESVRARFSSANGGSDTRTLIFELKLGKGLIARCVSGHGPGYSEHLEVQLAHRKILAYPGGLLDMYRLSAGPAHVYLRLKTFLHFLIHGFVGRPSVTMQSFERQLGAFAEALRGEPQALSGADARSGIHSRRIIEACRQSIQSDESWIAVRG